MDKSLANKSHMCIPSNRCLGLSSIQILSLHSSFSRPPVPEFVNQLD